MGTINAEQELNVKAEAYSEAFMEEIGTKSADNAGQIREGFHSQTLVR